VRDNMPIRAILKQKENESMGNPVVESHLANTRKSIAQMKSAVDNKKRELDELSTQLKNLEEAETALLAAVKNTGIERAEAYKFAQDKGKMTAAEVQEAEEKEGKKEKR